MDIEILIPHNQVELQEFTAVLWDKITIDNDHTQIQTYNQAAEKYNKQAGWEALIIIHNLKQIKMATVKKAAPKKVVVKKAASKKVVKKAVAKVSTVDATLAKVKTVGAPSQKTQIVELAEKGKTVDEIVAATGIKKTNVAWYFSKLKLGK
jgi:hypothetical protein